MKQSKLVVKKRHEAIIELFSKNEKLMVTDVANTLNVSELTIRRDFDLLEQQGYLQRFHGGAKKVSSYSENPPAYDSKGQINLDRKMLIAKRTADLIKDGDTVFINGGTTTLEVIKLIKYKNIVIITNNALACNIVDENCKAQLISTGGEYNSRNKTYSGLLATELIKKAYSSICILGVNGITANDGISTPFYPETLINQEFLRHNKGRAIVVADGSKLGKTFCFNTAPIESINMLVTDSSADPEELEKLKGTKTEIILID